MATKKLSLVPVERIEQSILVIRGDKVMLDADLAQLYGVPTRRLNEQVKRNRKRFLEDFMFQLTREEVEELNRSQIATGSQNHRDPRFRPYAFTEHGAVMAANVLNSPTAVQASIQVVRAFVRVRQLVASNEAFARKLQELEQKVASHDLDINVLDMMVTELMGPSPEHVQEPKKNIGFLTSGNKNKKRSRT